MTVGLTQEKRISQLAYYVKGLKSDDSFRAKHADKVINLICYYVAKELGDRSYNNYEFLFDRYLCLYNDSGTLIIAVDIKSKKLDNMREEH